MAPTSDQERRLVELRSRWEQDRASRLFLQLAEEYRRCGMPRDALAILDEGLRHHPTSLAGQVLLGRCRLDIGEGEGAVVALEGVIRRDPTHMVAYRHLVDAYLLVRDAERARSRLDLYAQLNPQDVELPALEARVGDLERARSQQTEEITALLGKPRREPAPAYVDESVDESAVSSLPEMPPSVIARELEELDPLTWETQNLQVAQWRGSVPRQGGAESQARHRDDAGALATDDGADDPSFQTLGGFDERRQHSLGLPIDAAVVRRYAEDARFDFLAEDESGEPQPSKRSHFDEVDDPLESVMVFAAAGPPASSPVPPPVDIDTDVSSEVSASEVSASEVAADEVAAAEVSATRDPVPVVAAQEAAVELYEAPAPPAPRPVVAPALEVPFGTIFRLPLLSWAAVDLSRLRPRRLAPPRWQSDAGAPAHSHPEAHSHPQARMQDVSSTLGELYLRQGHTVEARNVFQLLLERDPTDAAARRGLEQVVEAERTMPALDARSLLAGYPAEESGLTAKQAFVLHRYLDRIRSGPRSPW
jgi:tetratricopeptide (TPR) repeat protein